MMICLSLVASLIDAIFDIDWCCLLSFSLSCFFSFCSRNHQNDTASVSRDCLHKSQRGCHIQRRSFNGYMIHAIKQASRVVFLKLLGIAELIWDQRCSHMTDLLSTVWYLMHSRSVSRFRCLLSSRRDRVTLRVCMATLHWQAESAGCQHLWQLGNQGQGSSLSDPQLPAALHHTHTPPFCILTGPFDCPPPHLTLPQTIFLLVVAPFQTLTEFAGLWCMRRNIPNRADCISFEMCWQKKEAETRTCTSLFSMRSVLGDDTKVEHEDDALKQNQVIRERRALLRYRHLW